MLARCPGNQGMRNLDSVVVPCPNCGQLIEFFTDEAKRPCRCGRVLLREALPQCAEWCPAAAACLGQAIDLRELQKRVEKVKDDPRAKRCLESIRERLQGKSDAEGQSPSPEPIPSATASGPRPDGPPEGG